MGLLGFDHTAAAAAAATARKRDEEKCGIQLNYLHLTGNKCARAMVFRPPYCYLWTSSMKTKDVLLAGLLSEPMLAHPGMLAQPGMLAEPGIVEHPGMLAQPGILTLDKTGN